MIDAHILNPHAKAVDILVYNIIDKMATETQTITTQTAHTGIPQ